MRTLPLDFRNARIVSVFKEIGEKHQCGNYKCLPLLSVTGKTLARVLVERLLNKLMGKTQSTFFIQFLAIYSC